MIAPCSLSVLAAREGTRWRLVGGALYVKCTARLRGQFKSCWPRPSPASRRACFRALRSCTKTKVPIRPLFQTSAARTHARTARFPFAADRRVPLQGHHFKHRASGAQMSPDRHVSRPRRAAFQPSRATERRPDVVTRSHPKPSSADASTSSGLAPEEQEPVTWLQHPPIKIIT